MKSLILVAAFAAMFFLVSCGGGKKDEKTTDSTEVKTETVDTTVAEQQPAADVPDATTDVKPEKETEASTNAPVRGNR